MCVVIPSNLGATLHQSIDYRICGRISPQGVTHRAKVTNIRFLVFLPSFWGYLPRTAKGQPKGNTQTTTETRFLFFFQLRASVCNAVFLYFAYLYPVVMDQMGVFTIDRRSACRVGGGFYSNQMGGSEEKPTQVQT